jgi:hypothetical protein
MSTDAPRPGAQDEMDERTRRALEIHQRLMKEQGLDFYNLPKAPPAGPPPPPPSTDKDERGG